MQGLGEPAAFSDEWHCSYTSELRTECTNTSAGRVVLPSYCPLPQPWYPQPTAPFTGVVQPLAEQRHKKKWVRAVRNQVVFFISSAVCGQKWAGGMRLLLGTAMVCAWLTGHDTVVLHVGRAWFLKPISKTHLWTGFSNSGSCWVSLWKKALKTNWLTISEHKARDKSSWVPGVVG